MKKLLVALIALGLLVGQSFMAIAEQTATPDETQKWIQENAKNQDVPSVGAPVASTDTAKGSTDTVQGSTDTAKGSTGTVQGSTDTAKGSTTTGN